MATSSEEMVGIDPGPRLERRLTETRAADVLVDVLARAGVRVIFGIPGRALAALNDALLDRPEIRCITARHESGAMFAACGHARATQQVAVVMVTSGPGVLNAMTGLASAYCDGLPVVVLAGEVARPLQGKGALQEGSASHLNIVNMAKNISKLAFEVTDANAAPAALRRAITTAMSGRRGPVLVSLPLDVTTALIRRPGISSQVQVTWQIDELLIRKVARTLEASRRPLIFAGSGTRWGRGPEQLLTLAERLQIPVMTTPKAKGAFPESHPLSLGVFGHGGHPSTTEYLKGGVDVLLAIGTGLTDPATNGWSPLLRPTEHFIQIDADALNIGRNYPVSLALIGPAEFVLAEINASIKRPPSPRRGFGVKRVADPEQAKSTRGIPPERLIWELQQVMPEHTIYTCDIGEHLLFSTHYLEVDDPDGFLIMTGLASMGSSIAGALGVKLAKPERPVAAICGDGCFAMALGDLGVAVRERLPIAVVVLNDRRYGMVELGHMALYGRTPDYSCSELKIEDLARGVGADVVRIQKSGELLALDLASRLQQGPLVIEACIDPMSTMPRTERDKDLRSATLG